MSITITDRLKKIVNPKKRGKGRLPAAEDKGALLGGLGIGSPLAAEDAGTGLRPPFDEVPGFRAYYDEKSQISSDGFFVIVYQDLKSTLFLDQDATNIPVNYVEE